MAEKKTIELEIKSNLDSAERSVGSLKSQLRQAQAEVTALSDKFGATSREAVNAAKKAAELKDRIGDAKALTDAFNPDAKFKALSGSLNGIAGGFSVVTGAMGTLGAESKEVESAILKVQSAMAIASGAQALGESIDSFKQLGAVIKSTTVFQQISTAAQKLWNLAMSANPIGAVVLAITALLAAGTALVSWYKSSSDEAKKNSQAVKSNSQALESQKRTADKTADSIKKNSDYQLEMAKASGASSEAIRKLELKLVDEKIAYANSSREVAKNTYHKNLNTLASLKAAGAEEDVIAAQAETTKKSLEEFGKQTKNLNDANSEKIQIIRKHNVEKKQAETNHNKEVRDESKKAATEAKQKADDEAKQKAEQDEKQKQDLIRSQGEKAREEYEAAEKLIKDTRKANEDALKTENQLKVEKENAEFEAKKANLLSKGLSIEEIEKEHKRNLAKLDDEYFASEADKAIKSTADAKAQADAKIAIAQKEKEARIQAADAAANTLSGLSELLGKETAAGKAAAVASATINTFSSAQKAYDSTVGIPFVGPVLAPINAGIAIAAGIKNVKSILAVKTPKGGGGGSAPSGGGTGSGAVTAPSFNVVGASATNQLAQTIGNQQQQPIKAYVVANDVTTQQSLDRNIVQSASIG
jgi:chromosome segregation ATPase